MASPPRLIKTGDIQPDAAEESKRRVLSAYKQLIAANEHFQRVLRNEHDRLSQKKGPLTEDDLKNPLH